MSNHIHGLPGQHPIQHQKNEQNQGANGHSVQQGTPQGQGPNGAGSSQDDSVHVSKAFQHANNLAADIAHMSDVDSEKVAAIRAKIENGDYSVAPEKIAEKILQFEGLLSGLPQEEE